MSKQTDLINIPDAITVDGDNVGIGTSSPTAYTGYSTIALNSTNGGVLEFKKGDTQMARITNAGDPVLQFVTNNTERMRIDSSGRLMLGTTTEGQETADNLTIADTGHCGITLRSGASSVGTIFFSDATSGADEYVGYVQYNHADNYMKWQTNGAERMRINSSGNVGIGETTPAQKIHLRTSGVNTGARLQVAGGSGRAYDILSTTDGSLTITDANAGSERMRIDSSGRVTTPSQPSFSVSKTGGAVGQNTFVIFNHTEHNIGNHYNSSNGAFTAPVSGIYSISLNTMDNSNAIHVNKEILIYRNSYIYQRVYGTNGYAGSHGRWTWSGNIQMSANDTLQIYINAGMEIYGNQRDYTNFSGTLLG